MIRRMILLPALIVIIISASIVLAGGIYKSPNYTLKGAGITSGGGKASSPNYTIKNTLIGRPFGGESKSANYIFKTFFFKKRLPPNQPIISPVTTPTNNPTQTIIGTKDKNTSICINGYEAVPLNDQIIWQAAVTLEEGINTFSVTSKNKYNLESTSILVNITLDTLAPAVAITSPQDNAEVTSSLIRVQGTLSEPCAITVNGVLATVNDTTFIADNISLTYGSNTIVATATDLAGNTAQATINVTYPDKVPPTIHITSPLNGATINEAPITVTGTIDEPCDVLVSGILATVTGNKFTVENIDLHLGENTITATAYDLAGNSSEGSITVTSSATSDYDLTKVTADVYEDDPTNIIAGLQVLVTIRLEIDGSQAVNEPIEFHITQGNGSMVQAVVNTNASGEATGVLNTDVDADAANLVEVFDQNFPDKKVTFHIDTKEGTAGSLIKITDDSIHPVPGAGVDLIVKLEDANGNPIPDSEIGYQIISGPGALSSTVDVTNDYGNAHIILTTTLSQGTLCVVEARLVSNPSINATFNITTSSFSPVTVNDIMAKIAANDQLIQDVMADIAVTSNAPWSPAAVQLKIWQKGDKQKVQELSPEPGIYIRPPAGTGTPVNMTRTIISYDLATDIYTIKSIQEGQTEEYPYQIDHIDYGKGVITKSEQHVKDGDYIGLFITEYTNLVNIGGIWGFQTMTETAYDEASNQLYTTTNSYSNIQLNTGIPDSVFE